MRDLAHASLRLMGAAVAVGYVHQFVGTTAALLACFVSLQAGLVPSPFPLLYRAYTTKTVGYRLRHTLHPRLPPHVNTTNGIRRLVAAQGTNTSISNGEGVVVVPIPVLADNFSYMIGCERTRRCAVVDPADPKRVLEVVQTLGFTMSHVLTTHKHWDHAGGNEELVAMLGGPASVHVVGSAVDAPDAMSQAVVDGSVFNVGDVKVSVIATPGHTRGHLVYTAEHAPAFNTPKGVGAGLRSPLPGEIPSARPDGDATLGFDHLRDVSPLLGFRMSQRPVPSTSGKLPTCVDGTALFTGDCMFCGGCGHQFECRSPADILYTYDALHRLASAAPSNMLVYVGHEYTDRLFAEIGEQRKATMTPAIQSRLQEVQTLSRQRLCTVPSTMEVEMATNPMLTIDREVLQELAQKAATTAEAETAVYVSKRRRA